MSARFATTFPDVYPTTKTPSTCARKNSYRLVVSCGVTPGRDFKRCQKRGNSVLANLITSVKALTSEVSEDVACQVEGPRGLLGQYRLGAVSNLVARLAQLDNL